jgi:hypothetical protein
MATTTPNYGWSVPTSSDLVKNGATDIETLGDSVDASLWNSGYGQAGKNKVMNGDFRIAQRGTSFSNPADLSYTLDRWLVAYDGTGATRTVSQQVFTPGTAPVAGYEGSNFIRCAQTVAGSGNTRFDFRQRIEDVRTFAGQTMTISFWAKAAATESLLIIGDQVFGSGGSATVFNAFSSTTVTLTTNWQRFTYTASVASISGKTIGTSSYFNLALRITGGSTFTADIWGVQMEYGSNATPFQTATGTLQGELAACQRYFYRQQSNSTAGFNFGTGTYYNTTDAYLWIPFPVELRTTASASYTVGSLAVYANNGSKTPTGLSSSGASRYGQMITTTGITGATAGHACIFQTNGSTNAILDFSAEL